MSQSWENLRIDERTDGETLFYRTLLAKAGGTKKNLSPFYHKKNLGHLMGVLHSFSIKNIFYDKMDLGFFYFHVTISNF